MTPEEEDRGWQALLERWGDDEAHRSWLAGLGDLEAAFHWLETAERVRDLVWLTTGFPGIDPLRADPRFADLVRRCGIVFATAS